MTRYVHLIALTLGLAGSAAVAQQVIKNPDVKARVELMQSIRDQMKTLGSMAQGKIAFDAGQAAEAQRQLAELADRIPEKFEARATDPLTEADPAIWTNFADFLAKAKLLEDAAVKLGTGSLEELKQGIGPVGKACSACHETYRIEK